MLCNENCRMGDPANHLILSIVVSGALRNQKGMLSGRRFTHTRAAGARKHGGSRIGNSQPKRNLTGNCVTRISPSPDIAAERENNQNRKRKTTDFDFPN